MILENDHIILERLNDVSERVNRDDITEKVEIKIAKPLEQENAKSSFKTTSVEDFYEQFLEISSEINTQMGNFFSNPTK